MTLTLVPALQNRVELPAPCRALDYDVTPALRHIDRNANRSAIRFRLDKRIKLNRRDRRELITIEPRYLQIIANRIDALAPAVLIASDRVRTDNAARDGGDVTKRVARVVDLPAPHFGGGRSDKQQLTVAERHRPVERVRLTLRRRHIQRVDAG